MRVRRALISVALDLELASTGGSGRDRSLVSRGVGAVEMLGGVRR